MPKILRLPNEKDLPHGPRRDFAEAMFALYRLAGRPSLSAISAEIERDEQRRGTASRETIRRVLIGTSVPATFATVEVIMLALCAMADVEPDAVYVEDVWGHSVRTSHVRKIRNAWNRSLDEEPLTAARDIDEDPPF